ncbi:matE family protein, partial [Vibrio parahaemolyticus EKP-028]
RSSWE